MKWASYIPIGKLTVINYANWTFINMVELLTSNKQQMLIIKTTKSF